MGRGRHLWRGLLEGREVELAMSIDEIQRVGEEGTWLYFDRLKVKIDESVYRYDSESTARELELLAGPSLY
jgi:hypothetical protein